MEFEKTIEKAFSHTTEETRHHYTIILKKFFKEAGVPNLTTLDVYLEETRDFEKDIRNGWKDYMKSRAPKTRVSMCAILHRFFKRNKIILDDDLWEDIKIWGDVKTGKIIMDRRLTTNQFRQLMIHADARAKAFFMTLATSGMRIGEALQLEFRDFPFLQRKDGEVIFLDVTKLRHPEEQNMIIIRHSAKTGRRRITFITDETKEALKEWLKKRDRYMKVSSMRGPHCKVRFEQDYLDRVFPFTYAPVGTMWRRLLTQTNLDEKCDAGYVLGVAKRDKDGKKIIGPDGKIERHPGEWYVYHVHTLRKRFNTDMLGMGMPEIMVRELIGHSGYLGGVYDETLQSTLWEEYQKASPCLLVWATDVTGIEKDQKDLAFKVHTQEKQIEELRELLIPYRDALLKKGGDSTLNRV